MPLSEAQSMAWRNPAISVTTFSKQTFHPIMLCPFYKQKCADSIVYTAHINLFLAQLVNLVPGN